LIQEQDEEAESVTLGGYVAEKLGRFPVVGDQLMLGSHTIRVLRAAAHGAELVLISPRVEEKPPE
jgi:CBS domain containing-hemolysin-like protein